MSSYFGKYNTSGDVQTALENGELLNPYVALVGNDVDYNSIIYYKGMPLTFEILTDGYLNWVNNYYFYAKTIEYSINGGNWISKASDANNKGHIDVQAGDIVRVRGNNPSYNFNGFWNDTAEFNVYGNIMSLVNATDYASLSSFTANQVFENFFANSTVVSAENLILPARVRDACYRGMFKGCSGLTTAPELPAEELGSACYRWMFSGCSNLNYIKCLATYISAAACTDLWVDGVQTTSGTFITPSTTSWTTGTSGIPTGWTRVNSE